MATVAACRVQPAERIVVAFDNVAEINCNAHIRGHVPYANTHTGPFEHFNDPLTVWIVHRHKIQSPGELNARVHARPQCHCVTFDDFANSMINSFKYIVSGSETIAALNEATGSRSSGFREIDMYQLIRNPHVQALQQIKTLDPQHACIRAETAVDQSRQSRHVDNILSSA